MKKIKAVMFIIRGSKDLRWLLGNRYAYSEIRE